MQKIEDIIMRLADNLNGSNSTNEKIEKPKLQSFGSIDNRVKINMSLDNEKSGKKPQKKKNREMMSEEIHNLNMLIQQFKNEQTHNDSSAENQMNILTDLQSEFRIQDEIQPAMSQQDNYDMGSSQNSCNKAFVITKEDEEDESSHPLSNSPIFKKDDMNNTSFFKNEE